MFGTILKIAVAIWLWRTFASPIQKGDKPKADPTPEADPTPVHTPVSEQVQTLWTRFFGADFQSPRWKPQPELDAALQTAQVATSVPARWLALLIVLDGGQVRNIVPAAKAMHAYAAENVPTILNPNQLRVWRLRTVLAGWTAKTGLNPPDKVSLDHAAEVVGLSPVGD